MPDICTVTSLYHYQTSCALLASRERPRDSHRDSHRDKHRRVGSSDRRRSAEPQAEATELNQREQDDIDKRAQRALAWQKKQADKQAAQVRFLHTDACSLTHSLTGCLYLLRFYRCTQGICTKGDWMPSGPVCCCHFCLSLLQDA